MTFADDLKNKVDEVHLQEKAKDFGDAVADVLKAAVGLVAGYTQQNRDSIAEALDKAERMINDKTDGKHADTVIKVRASVERGIDTFVEQGGARPGGAAAPPAPEDAPAVPDDTHSAFPDEPPGAAPEASRTPPPA